MTLVESNHNSCVIGSAAAAAQQRRVGRVDELQRQVERLMPVMRIGVIYGGDKAADGAVINATFNPRAWKSYQAVAEDIAEALRRVGFRHVVVMPEDMHLGARLRQEGIHLAWINSGGVQGCNPMAHAAAMLEMCGIPYVGHDPLTAGMLDNKHVFKQALKALDIPTPEFVVSPLSRNAVDGQLEARVAATFGAYRGPFVVKPVSGRASLNVNLVEEFDDLVEVVGRVHRETENHVLIEAFMPGREYCIAVTGPVTSHGQRLARHDEPFVFAEIERMLDPGEAIFTSMDLRPITRDRARLLTAQSDGMVLSQLREIARRVFVDLNLESIIRLDVRADRAGCLSVLEANPKPDLKAPTGDKISLVCSHLHAVDMSYDDLILSLLADRLDLLFSQRRNAVKHLTALMT